MLSTSVVISVFNGSQYLVEQLDSIREQTVAPDEVIIVDDCSTDGSFEQIGSYIEYHHLPWYLFRNESNRGFRANFHHLASIASSDLIFFCDQDDIWHFQKIEISKAIMEKNPNIDVLCSEYLIWKGKEIPESFQFCCNTNMESIGLDAVTPHHGKPYIWLGCAMCARNSFIKAISQYWPEEWAHDECLWKMSQAANSCNIARIPLILHRVHTANATGHKVHDKTKRMRLIEEKAGGDFCVYQFCIDNNLDQKIANFFLNSSKCESLRITLLKSCSTSKQFSTALKLLRYLYYYPELKSFVMDIAIANGLKK